MYKEYLGDSVYIELNTHGQLVLTIENGLGPSNTIILEPEVWVAMQYYTQRLPALMKQKDET